MKRYTIELLRDKDYEVLDCVTMKAKMIIVDQTDGRWPPYAEVMASPMVPRRPLGINEQNLLQRATSLKEFIPTIESRDGEKWCSQCGEWRPFSYFPKKADTHDGHHPYCRECQTAQEKRRRLVNVYEKYGLKAA